MSEEDKKPAGNIHRRGFLKGIAATGAMGAISGIHSVSAAQSANENRPAAKSWRKKPDPIDGTLISDGVRLLVR